MDEAEHGIAWMPLAGTVANVDRACEIPAEDLRKCRIAARLGEHTERRLRVPRTDARGIHANHDLTIGWGWVRHIVDDDAVEAGEPRKNDSTHDRPRVTVHSLGQSARRSRSTPAAAGR